jgi:6-phosphofructokinase 1
MGSHERIGIIELFGRSAGFVALTSAYATNTNRVVIPECEFLEEKLLDYLIKDREENKSKYSLVLMAEGARRIGDSEEIVKSKNKDLYGHEKLGGIGEIFKEFVEHKTMRGTVFESLTYIIRCGNPTDFDQRIGKKYARMAIEHIVRGEYGKMMAVQNGKLTAVNIDLVTSDKRRVDIDKFYDKERYLPLNKNWTNTSVML